MSPSNYDGSKNIGPEEKKIIFNFVNKLFQTKKPISTLRLLMQQTDKNLTIELVKKFNADTEIIFDFNSVLQYLFYLRDYKFHAGKYHY